MTRPFRLLLLLSPVTSHHCKMALSFLVSLQGCFAGTGNSLDKVYLATCYALKRSEDSGKTVYRVAFMKILTNTTDVWLTKYNHIILIKSTPTSTGQLCPGRPSHVELCQRRYIRLKLCGFKTGELIPWQCLEANDVLPCCVVTEHVLHR